MQLLKKQNYFYVKSALFFIHYNAKRLDNLSMKGVFLMNNNKMSLAAIYISEQPYNSLYSLPEALSFGTIFPELNMPYSKINR